MSTKAIERAEAQIKKKLSLSDYRHNSGKAESIEINNSINTEAQKEDSSDKKSKFCFYISKKVVQQFQICHAELNAKAVHENKKVSKSALLEEALMDLVKKKEKIK